MRPRPSPSTTSPSSSSGAPEAAHRALDVARGDQGPDPGRRDGLAVDLDERLDPGLELGVRAQHLRVALRPRAEAEVLADRDGRGPQRLDQDARAELLRLDPAELLIERDDHQLRDAEPLDHVALDLERHDQLRRRLGVDDAERVRLEGQDGVGALDHLAVADVHAVEGADRDPSRARLGLVQRGDGDAHRTELWQLPIGRRASASASAIGACSSASPTANGPIAVRRNSVQYASPRSATRLRT